MQTETAEARASNGFVEPGFEPVAEEFARLLGRGPGGGALVIRRADRVLADLCIGWADAGRTRRWEPGTQALGFSATKGLASMVIHRLADRGLLDYDEPVATYWPEFAVNGKDEITVAQLLSHRAGLYDVQAIAESAHDLLDHELLEVRLAGAVPDQPGVPAYHAFTFGWLAAGLARKVTGKGMRELVRDELAEPLGSDGLELGHPTRPAAEMTGSSLNLYTRLGSTAAPFLGWLPLTKPGFRALHAPGFVNLCQGPDPMVWRTEMPAINGALTAGGLARLYEPLANGGLAADAEEPFLSPETVDALGRVQTRGMDRVLAIRMRWRMGFHHAFGTGSRVPRALGHFGFGGCGGWGDPGTGISFGLVRSHLGTLTSALGDVGILRLTGQARRCAERAL